MNTRIELKSALLGLTVGLAVTFALGASGRSAPIGRYQITGTANYGLVIDTTTGEVWHEHRAAHSFLKSKLNSEP